MKHLVYILILISVAFVAVIKIAMSARAATVTADLRDIGNTALNTPVEFIPKSNPQSQFGTIIGGVTKTVTPTNGIISTNIVGGVYDVRIKPYLFTVYVPTNDTTYTLISLATNGLNVYTYTSPNTTFRVAATSGDTNPAVLAGKLIGTNGITMATNATSADAYLSFQVGLSQNVFLRYGSGSPEGSVTGNLGAIFINTNGSTNTMFYLKVFGTNTSTGWAAK